MWYEKSVFYQIYPLGFCGAPFENNGEYSPRIKKIADWIPHLKKLNVDCLYLCPVFESDTHGYDTRDYSKIDCRLGNNDDFKEVCRSLKENGIRVVLDGVFNHVGRGFFAFKDVREKKWDSQYKDWFNVSFDGNSCYNDGFWYEGWEGHYELVKLNLKNPQVKTYLFECVGKWIDEFDIDGIRLDVAYMLDMDFMQELKNYCDSKKSEFFFLGEMIHGDYNRILNIIPSVTNYECYKGIYSAFNCMNMFEIGHSMQRQFGNENWCLYRGKHLVSFVDNHDVTRIASILTNINHLPLVFGLQMAMPSIPMIYYGSEWGAKGNKGDRDLELRPSFDKPEFNEVTEFISKCALVHKISKALVYGGFRILHMTNHQLVFERACEGERVLVMINADENDYQAYFNTEAQTGVDLITESTVDLNGGCFMEKYSVKYVRC